MRVHALSVMLVGLCAAAVPAPAQSTVLRSDEQDAVKRIIAAEADGELALFSLNPGIPIRASDIVLDTVAAPLQLPLRVWRGRAATVSSIHPYLVASSGNAIWRLGGFSSPELSAIAARFPARLRSAAEAVERARVLARLADPNGAADVRFVAAMRASADSGIVEQWRAARPKGWPVDSVAMPNDSTFVVQLTALSWQGWSGYGRGWVPIAYRFTMDAEGGVLGWRRRTAEQLSERSGAMPSSSRTGVHTEIGASREDDADLVRDAIGAVAFDSLCKQRAGTCDVVLTDTTVRLVPSFSSITYQNARDLPVRMVLSSEFLRRVSSPTRTFLPGAFDLARARADTALLQICEIATPDPVAGRRMVGIYVHPAPPRWPAYARMEFVRQGGRWRIQSITYFET